MKKIIYISIFIAIFCSSVYSQVYNWFPINSGTTNNLNCINVNLIAGANGTLLASSNNGASWYPRTSGTTNELKSIANNGSNVIFITGSLGTILRSTNSGVNWSVIPSGTTNNLNSASKTGAAYCYVAGSGGKILFTSNTGDNWLTRTSNVTTDLNSASAFGFFCWIAGNNGVILYTTNWGETWVQQSSGTTANLNSIIFTNIYTGWAAGNNGTILKTTNSGQYWISLNSGTSANLRAIAAAGWAVGDNGIVLKSTNSGMNWTIQNANINTDLNSVLTQSSEFVFAVGKNGKIYQRRVDSLYVTGRVFAPNNISTIINNTGIFNQDVRYANTPGFVWPKGSGKTAIFTSGLSIAAKYNGLLREAMGSYTGEYTPGYIYDSSGIPVVKTDNRFRIYSVKRGDSSSTNQDWVQWGQMVPFGAPYVDINSNGQYEPLIDIPGMKGASQTIFLCMTDGFDSTHKLGEGFGGGTAPLFAEVHLTAWGFDDKPGLEDVQFLKWDVINKSKVQWQSTYFSIFSDVDLGGPTDDFIGCDTMRNLGYCYNGDNDDEQGTNSYGINPPAVGMQFLDCMPGYAKLSSFDFTVCGGCPAPVCELDPNGEPIGAYNFMRGLKKDETPWVVPPGGNASYITKYNFSGDWDESDGRIGNCGLSLSGPFYPGIPWDRRMIMNYGGENKTLNPNDTQKILIAQLIARGNSNLNSVTKLLNLSNVVKAACDSGIIFGVKEISSQIPAEYKLYQNYPNPFNPITKIKIDISSEVRSQKTEVRLVIYDVLGRAVTTLVNEKLNSGTFEAKWDGTNYSSGIYFYSLLIDGILIDSKKMLLIK